MSFEQNANISQLANLIAHEKTFIFRCSANIAAENYNKETDFKGIFKMISYTDVDS